MVKNMSPEEIAIIISTVSAVATVFMVYFTYRMAKSTKESVDEMRLTRKEANSAEVIAYLKVESFRIYFIIENVGNTIAKNVNLSFKPELIDSHDHIFENSKHIDFLPPNYPIKTFFDTKDSYYNKFNETPRVNIKLSFENIYGKTVQREYNSDLHYLRDMKVLTPEMDTAEMSLHKIYKELEKFNKNN